MLRHCYCPLRKSEYTHLALHVPLRDTELARARGIEDGLGVGGLDGGGDVSNIVHNEAAGGRAALAVPPYRVLSVAAGDACLARSEHWQRGGRNAEGCRSCACFGSPGESAAAPA